MHFAYFLHCDSAFVTPSNDGVYLVTTNKIASLTRWTPSFDGVTRGGNNCKGKSDKGGRIIVKGENNCEGENNREGENNCEGDDNVNSCIA
jgi:hypothetical protein